ncbi:MAG: alanine--tRNA ligase, partial [Campylobacter sp.]|nr:alanine--tRNA ligase [Campylobacter sp.]
TSKMGHGMNVQNKLFALHHLDVPWRPSDMVQREGRILRKGNENEKVQIACGVKGANAKAGEIVKEVAKILGGGGGGRDDFATAGGKDISKISQAIAFANEFIKAKI